MAKTLSGLFTGPSAADVRMAMGLESDARIRQAGEDAKAGGFIPSYIAQARQKGVEALQPLMGAGIQFLGGEVPQDPRLAKAVKRDQDKKFIINKLGTLAGADGKWNKDEMLEGYKLLMDFGYPEEARKFLADAKMMVDMDRLEAVTEKAKRSGTTGNRKVHSVDVISDDKDLSTGKRYIQTRTTYKNGDTQIIVRDQYGKKYTQEEYERVVKNKKLQPVDSDGLTSFERSEENRIKEAGKLFVKEKSEARENLRTNEELVNKVRQAIAILPTIKTGGVAKDFMGVTSYLGITDENVGQFNNITAGILLTSLGKLGANPTEGERKFIQMAEAGMTQSREVNDRILKELLNILQRNIDLDSFLVKPSTSLKQWEEKLSTRSEKISKDLLGLSNSFANPIKIPSNVYGQGPNAVKTWLKTKHKATKGYYFTFPNGELRQFKG